MSFDIWLYKSSGFVLFLPQNYLDILGLACPYIFCYEFANFYEKLSEMFIEIVLNIYITFGEKCNRYNTESSKSLA